MAGRDLSGDMLSVDLEPYDLLIATPPCNYYSRGNYRRETSEYSQKTKHLLPEVIKLFKETGKPFIVENVINKPLMADIIKYCKENNIFYKELGRHSYFTNIDIDISGLPQIIYIVENTHPRDRQGGINVNNTFNYIIKKMKVLEK